MLGLTFWGLVVPTDSYYFLSSSMDRTNRVDIRYMFMLIL